MNTGIEIRQDLIADEPGEAQWAERLANVFAEIEVELRLEQLI
jgi:predicted N-formylglutamate amidohydrolase